MKIAVFGWYGHDNAGDERIKFSLNHFLKNLGGIDSVDFFDLHENAIKGKTNQFDCYDLIIIGGGGLILSQYNYHDFINGINTNIITAGISVETTLKGNPKKFALALIRKSLVVLVRDQDSAQKLSYLDPTGKVKLSSDLTFLAPYETIPPQETNLIGINLLPKPKHIKYSTLAVPFVSFMLRQLQKCGLQNTFKIYDFHHIIYYLNSHFNLLPIPLYCAPQKNNIPLYEKNDIEYLKLYFPSVSDHFSDELMNKCAAFLSMRLHAAIFAVQKGIPILSFPYLPKNINFMASVGLSDFVVESMDPLGISRLMERALNNKNIIREKMAIFKDNAAYKVRNDMVNAINLIK